MITVPEFDETPDWTPLERAVQPEERADYMHMGRLGTIQMYKHCLTRRYLNIDSASGACLSRTSPDGVYRGVSNAVRYSQGMDEEIVWS